MFSVDAEPGPSNGWGLEVARFPAPESVNRRLASCVTGKLVMIIARTAHVVGLASFAILLFALFGDEVLVGA